MGINITYSQPFSDSGRLLQAWLVMLNGSKASFCHLLNIAAFPTFQLDADMPKGEVIIWILQSDNLKWQQSF